MEKRALGKGLSALIPDNPEVFETEKTTERVAYVKTDSLRENSLQPRLHYDQEKMEELKNSIQEKGVLQPILVREVEDGYEVVAGERRLKAVQMLNMDEIPVIIKKVSSEEALVLALVENIQREELNAIEEAQAFKRLVEEFDLTHEEVAKSVGKDRSTITNTIRLLRLPKEIQESVFSGSLSMGHARTLLGLEDAVKQKQLFEKIMQKGLSVREVESLVKTDSSKTSFRKSSKAKPRSHDVVHLEEELQQVIGSKVRIQAQKKRGKIIIEYYSPDDLERIIQLIKK